MKINFFTLIPVFCSLRLRISCAPKIACLAALLQGIRLGEVQRQARDLWEPACWRRRPSRHIAVSCHARFASKPAPDSEYADDCLPCRDPL